MKFQWEAFHVLRSYKMFRNTTVVLRHELNIKAITSLQVECCVLLYRTLSDYLLAYPSITQTVSPEKVYK